jgi:hypothetical protein
MGKVQQWEYRRVKLSGEVVTEIDGVGVRLPRTQEQLAEVGEEGWELVGVTSPQPGEILLFFKRPQPRA